MRMMMNGMNVSRSFAVRRSAATSRGLSTPPSSARQKSRPAAATSPPSSRTPRMPNWIPSLTVLMACLVWNWSF